MKKLLHLLIIMAFPLLGIADNVKTVDLSFDLNDFNLNQTTNDLLEISTVKHRATYDSDTCKPGLPIIGVNVIVPFGTEFQGMSTTSSKRLIRSNILLEPNPLIVPTGTTIDTLVSSIPTYALGVFPEDSVQYVSTNEMGCNTMMSFLISPFEYDTSDNNLYFRDSISINIQYSQAENLPNQLPGLVPNYGNTDILNEILSQIVVNPEDIVGGLIDDLVVVDTTGGHRIYPPRHNVDYLIITADSLASSFEGIATWKTTKGLRTEVKTIEDIAQNYSGNSLQHKIKNCLHNYYVSKGLKYVLLGGDDVIVPVQYCYVKVTDSILTNTMPSDLYYSCFGGSFDWDGDGDGILGEVEDNVSFTPSIFLSRLPIRTQADVEVYTDKLLCYERNPLSKVWNNTILMSGVHRGKCPSTPSDAEQQADVFYESYIEPYWPGQRHKFFDTYTDFTGGAAFRLDRVNLQNKLQNGYTFFDMTTHGSASTWLLEYGKYHNTEAMALQNAGFTFISTTACTTNAFDTATVNIDFPADPCLSEAFIRNPKSGVVAYLGCSREGWGYHDKARLGDSFQYEAGFYNQLFDETCNLYRYAELVTSAKIAMLGHCYKNSSWRWVQMGLNPVGDPELPLFTCTPIAFTNCNVYSSEDSIMVNTGTEGCTVCVMSTDDLGESYYEVRNNVDSTAFSKTDKELTVCITKRNHIPWIVQVIPQTEYIQNETVIGPQDYNADIVKIGSDVTTTKPSGPVTFDGGTTTVNALTIVIEPSTTVNNNTTLILSNQ